MTEKNKELIQRMRSIAQASMGPDAVRVPPGIQALIDGADALEAALAQQPQGEAVALPELHAQGLYTMDQMRDYADAYHRTRVAAAPVAQGLTESMRSALIAAICEHTDSSKSWAEGIIRKALAQSAPRADHAGEGAEMVATGKQSLKVDPSASAGQAEPDAFEEARKAYVALTNAVAFEGDRARYIASQTIMDCFDRLFAAPAPNKD